MNDPPLIAAAILDVDGVLLASPHEQAWRAALAGIADPACFTTALYQAKVAGKPRLSGAIAALTALGVSHAAEQAPAYAAAKQTCLEKLIQQGAVEAFPDALRFVLALSALGWPIAAASSSKNANPMMKLIQMGDGRTLFDMFAANDCGRDLEHGKPDPEIFLLAAKALGIAPPCCLVAEDSTAGIEAARAGGMAGLGIARLDNAVGLLAAGATLVVTSLDEVAMDLLAHGKLARRPA